MAYQINSFPLTMPPFNPYIFPNKVPSYFKISSMRRISSSVVQLEPLFLLTLVSGGRPNCTSITSMIFSNRYSDEINKADDNMYIYYVTNIIPDVYISFCVLCTFHETACILEKNQVEYILNRVENIKILLNWVYTQPHFFKDTSGFMKSKQNDK